MTEPQVEYQTSGGMTPEQKVEMDKINTAINNFAEVMRERMKEKLLEGYTAWDRSFSWGPMMQAILDDVKFLDFYVNQSTKAAIDIANRCMMIWFRVNSPPAARLSSNESACGETSQ